MYICIYVYMYICIYVYMYICIYVYMYICIYVYMYICVHMYIYMYICIYVYMYICIYVYMYICIYGYMYICTEVTHFKWTLVLCPRGDRAGRGLGGGLRGPPARRRGAGGEGGCLEGMVLNSYRSPHNSFPKPYRSSHNSLSMPLFFEKLQVDTLDSIARLGKWDHNISTTQAPCSTHGS